MIYLKTVQLPVFKNVNQSDNKKTDHVNFRLTLFNCLGDSLERRLCRDGKYGEERAKKRQSSYGLREVKPGRQ